MLFPNSADTTETIQKYFRRKRIPYTEDALIAVLEDGTQRQAVYWAVLGLRDVGTMKAVPALQAQLHYPMRDVKDCAVLTVAHIAGPAATDFYVHALQDKRTQKFYPMWAIRVAADERAIDAVLLYVDRELKRIERPSRPEPADAFDDGLAFLSRFAAVDPRIPPIFDRVRRVGYVLPTATQANLEASTGAVRMGGIDTTSGHLP